MTFRPSRTKQREALYKSECEKSRAAGRGEFPICVHCDLSILPGQTWDACHDPHKPRWLGGAITGCGHTRCNRIHNNTHDTPLYAKVERQRKRHLDFVRSATPLPGGRDDRLRKKVDGSVVSRGVR